MEELGRVRRGGWFTTALLGLVALPLFVLAVMELVGLDGNWLFVAALTLVPYLMIVSILMALSTLLLRRWIVGIFVVLAALIFALTVIPRVLPHSRANGDGQRFRVLSVDVGSGSADYAAIVGLVRGHRVDVLSVQGLTAAGVTALEQAGLTAELPHQVIAPGEGVTGAGLYARQEIKANSITRPSTYAQPSGSIAVPGRPDVEIVAVHTIPSDPGNGSLPWQRDLAGLPEHHLSGPVRVLAGDFNATLDHAALHGILNQGYADAAAEVGAAWRPTWPIGRLWPPPMAVDHVLVDRRCPVEDYQVFDVPGAGHRAVFAEFSLLG